MSDPSSGGLLRRIGRGLMTPPFIAFSIIATPILVLSYAMRPGNQKDLIQDLDKRYGYTGMKQIQERNAKAMEVLFENRHKSIGDFTPGFKHPPKSEKKE